MLTHFSFSNQSRNVAPGFLAPLTKLSLDRTLLPFEAADLLARIIFSFSDLLRDLYFEYGKQTFFVPPPLAAITFSF
jgi:hypothetical protein